jgi:hypothetical protein
MSGSPRIVAAVVAGLAAVGLAACEPPPPRLQLTVDSALDSTDDDPGDGVCSSAAAGGACTLRAAIDEGNAAPDGADIAVPTGHYGNINVLITGDVAIEPLTSADVRITDSTITVAAGASLAVSAVNTSTSISSNPNGVVALLQLDVAGTAVIARSFLGSLDIAAGGGALLVDSVVDSIVDPAGIVNHGTLLALRSSLLHTAANGPAGTALTTGPGGSSHLTASVLAVAHTLVAPFNLPFPGGGGTCAGTAPTSGSFLFVEDPCGAMDGPGDGSGDALTTATVTFTFTGVGPAQAGSSYSLMPTSPLVDAIPIGDGACPPGAVDVYGQPRGVDGDGDGIGGCDIGAVELQP